MKRTKRSRSRKYMHAIKDEVEVEAKRSRNKSQLTPPTNRGATPKHWARNGNQFPLELQNQPVTLHLGRQSDEYPVKSAGGLLVPAVDHDKLSKRAGWSKNQSLRLSDEEYSQDTHHRAC